MGESGEEVAWEGGCDYVKSVVRCVRRGLYVGGNGDEGEGKGRTRVKRDEEG